MMKILICLSMVISTLSCDNKVSSEHKISFHDWRSSIKNMVADSDLKDFEKENLIISVNKVSQEDFLDLKEVVDRNEIVREYYIFYSTEGEVSTDILYYIVENKNKSYLTNLTIQRGVKLFSNEIISSDIKFSELLKKENNQSYSDTVIVTRIHENSVVSNFKRVNNDIVNFLN